MVISFLRGLLEGPKQQNANVPKPGSNPKVVSLREERASLARRLQRLKAQMSSIDREVHSMSGKPLSKQRREAKKAIIEVKRRRRKLEDKLMTDKLKFAIVRYARLTDDKTSWKLLSMFADDPLKHADHVGIADALKDLKEKIDDKLVPTRESETNEILGILRKLSSKKLLELIEIEREFRLELEKNNAILSSSNPLKRASSRQRSVKQEMKNVENELELVSGRIRTELKK